MKKDRLKISWIREEDHQIAKSIASLKGMSMVDYFGQKIREDAPILRQQFEAIQNKNQEQQKRGRGRIGLPF